MTTLAPPLTAERIDEIARQRVRRGAAWLDDHGPDGWRDFIDLRTLDVDDAENCVLGQVFRFDAREAGVLNGYLYVTVFDRVDPHGEVGGKLASWTYNRGFMALSDYDETMAAWRDYLS